MRRKTRVWKRGILVSLAFGVAALAATTAGMLDTTFDGDGLVETGATNGYAWAVGVQSTGRVLIGGNDRGNGWRVRRYDTGGSLDTSFAASGVFAAFGDDELDTVFDIAVDAQDRIYLLGKAGYEETVTTGKGKHQTTTTVVKVKSILVRLDADGGLDTAFGTSGAVVLDLPDRDSWAGARSIELAGGSLVVSGETSVLSGKGKNKTVTPAVAVLKLDASDGSLDTGFDGDGIIIDTNDGAIFQVRFGLAVDSDGSVYVAAWPGSGDRWEILKYTSSGARDGSLASPDPDASLEDLVIDASDRVIAVGKLNTGTTVDDEDGLVVRYTASGALDTSYGTGGATVTGLAERDLFGSVAIHGSGVVALGLNWPSGAANADTEAFVMRFDADGDADTAFGPGTLAGLSETIQPGGGTKPATDPTEVVVDPNGDIIAGGTYYDPTANPLYDDWFLARWSGN